VVLWKDGKVRIVPKDVGSRYGRRGNEILGERKKSVRQEM
jgi:hypothetical protein